MSNSSRVSREKYQFPPDDIDPKKKNKAWILEWAKAFYDHSTYSGGSLFYNNRGQYAKNLLYAQGKQGIQQYKEEIGCNTESSFVNMNWDIFPIMPKFIDVVVANMQKRGYNIQCNAIDPIAIDTEKQTKHNLQANALMQKTLAGVEQKMGMQFDNPQEAMDPKTFEEIEVHMSLRYKHKMAITAEKGIALMHKLNNWDSISEHLDRDLVVYGACVTKDYVGPDGLPKIRRVDPDKLLTLFSKTPNFKGCGGFGEMVTMTVAEFERKASYKFGKKERQELYDLFSKKTTQSTNRTHSYGNIDTLSYGGNYSQFGTAYDDLVIDVFDCEFASTNTDVYERKENRFGNTGAYKKDYNYKAPKNPKHERNKSKVEKDSYSVWYKAMWIVDTEHMFNYGLVTDQKVPRSSFSEALSSYTAIVPGMTNMSTISLVEKMTSIVDDIQILIVKLRQAVARAKPKGILIEIGSLENIPSGTGGTSLEPLEVIAMYEDTGNLIYRSLDDQGRPVAPPVKELENGMANDVATLVNLINFKIGLLNDVTGVNNVTDASSPDPKMLKGVAEIAIAGTNNALNQLYAAKKFMVEEAAYSMLLRLQEAVKENKVTGYAQALGQTDAEFIEVHKDISLHEFGMIIEDVPDDQEKVEFSNMLAQALKNQEITISQYYTCKSIPNLKLAQKDLELSVKKTRETNQQDKDQLIKSTGEEQRKSAQETKQGEMDQETHKTNQKMRLAKFESDLKTTEDERQNHHEKVVAKLNHHMTGDLDDHKHRNAERAKVSDRAAELEAATGNGFQAPPDTVNPGQVAA